MSFSGLLRVRYSLKWLLTFHVRRVFRAYTGEEVLELEGKKLKGSSSWGRLVSMSSCHLSEGLVDGI